MAVNNAQIVIQNGQVTTYVQPNIALISINQGSFSGGGGGAVSSVTGTVNQIIASPTTGAVILTLPSFVQFPGTWAEGTLSYSDTGILWSAQSSVNSYDQVIVQNTNNGATASSNYIVSNDQGTATTFFGEFGMNSSGFTGSMVFQKPNYVYLDSTSADLAIGTTTNNAIHFVVNGGTTDALTISGAGAISIPAFNTNSLIKTTGGIGVLALAIAGTDYLTNGNSGAGLTDVWLLPSGGILSGPNVVTGSASNTFKMVFNSLGTTQTDGAGIYLQNTTAATNGNQQNSPSITWEGRGFGTTGGITQVVKYISDVLPVQGSNATGIWRLRQSLNGAAYGDVFTVTSSGITNTPNNGGYGSSGGILSFYVNSNVERARISGTNFLINSTSTNAQFYHVQSALASGWTPIYRSDPGAHTGITASTELISRDFQGATQQWATGPLTTQRWNHFKGYTATFVASSTLTNAYTVYIDPPATNGTNATVSNPWALGLNGALQLYAGTTTMPPLVFQSGTNSSTIINGAVEFDGTHFYGAISGSRVQLDNQVAANGWLANGATTITGNTSQSGAFTETMSFNKVSVTQNVLSGVNNLVALTVETNAHTTQTFSSNATTLGVNQSTFTIQFNTGAISTIATSVLASGNTYSFVGSSTITDAPNVWINGIPKSGTNATITNAHGIFISSTATTGTVTNSYGLTVNAQTGATNNFSAQFAGGIGLKFTQASQSATHTFIDITQSAHTGGIPIGFKFTSGAHTGLSSAGTITDVSFVTGATKQFASNPTVVFTSSIRFDRPTYAFAVAGGIVNTATNVYIVGQPNGGTNATITKSVALYVDGATVSNVTSTFGLSVIASAGATDNYSAEFVGGRGVQLNHLIGNTSAPSIAAGTGAGTGPTVSVSGTDLAGTVTVTTGTAPAGANAIIATITFNGAGGLGYSSAPKVILTAANRNANGLIGVNQVLVPANGQTNGVTTTTFVIEANTSGLAASTTYLWTYMCIQ